MSFRRPPSYDLVAQADAPGTVKTHTDKVGLSAHAIVRESDRMDKDSQPPSTTTSAPGWGIGWKIPGLIIVPFVFAILLAIAHAIFFLCLRGRTTEAIPQTYVTTTSTILANLIGLCLRVSLGTAFVQYLWYIIRHNHYRIDRLNDMFSMRSDPLALIRAVDQRRAKVLILLTLYLWLTMVAVSFPPGAITVQPQTKVEMASVPSFNHFNPLPLDQGDDAMLSALESQALHTMVLPILELDDGYAVAGFLKPGLLNSAGAIMTSGERSAMPSPCGADCSFNIQFRGPYFQCRSTSSNLTVQITDRIGVPVYDGIWGDYTDDMVQSGNLSFSTMTYLAYATFTDYKAADLVKVTQTNVTCSLSEADYEVSSIYQNNVQSLSYQTSNARAIDASSNQYQAVCWPTEANSPCEDNTVSRSRFVELNNNWAILYSFAEPLSGLYNGSVSGDYDTVVGTSQTDGLDLVWRPASVSLNAPPLKPAVSSFSETPQLIARLTPLATAFGTDTDSMDDPVEGSLFEINEEVLNEMLANITLSTINMGLWNQTVEVRRNLTTTVYALSKPLDIALPYGLLLTLALPFLVLGLWSLHANGSPAQDGGFYQLLVTTSASEELHRAAKANGCLGEPPEDLKRLEVRFGELVNQDGNNGTGTYLGFGTKDEVVPIVKGRAYGRNDDARSEADD